MSRLGQLYKTPSEHNESAMSPKLAVKADVGDRQGWANNGSREVIRSPRRFSRKQRPGCFAQLL
jgi:hypothetical protein